jgi:hypothetical protein
MDRKTLLDTGLWEAPKFMIRGHCRNISVLSPVHQANPSNQHRGSRLPACLAIVLGLGHSGQYRQQVKLTAAALNHRDLFLRQHLYPGVTFDVPLLADGVLGLGHSGQYRQQYRLRLRAKVHRKSRRGRGVGGLASQAKSTTRSPCAPCPSLPRKGVSYW